MGRKNRRVGGSQSSLLRNGQVCRLPRECPMHIRAVPRGEGDSTGLIHRIDELLLGP